MFYREAGSERTRSLPAAWTDVVGVDPFVVLAQGRSFFRVQELLCCFRWRGNRGCAVTPAASSMKRPRLSTRRARRMRASDAELVSLSDGVSAGDPAREACWVAPSQRGVSLPGGPGERSGRAIGSVTTLESAEAGQHWSRPWWGRAWLRACWAHPLAGRVSVSWYVRPRSMATDHARSPHNPRR